MDYHTAADKIGRETFQGLLPEVPSSFQKWERLRRSIRTFGPLSSELGYYSLVHAFSETGRDHLIRYLILKGVNIDQKDLHGRTPCSIAIENGRETVVKLLKENGASLKELSPTDFLDWGRREDTTLDKICSGWSGWSPISKFRSPMPAGRVPSKSPSGLPWDKHGNAPIHVAVKPDAIKVLQELRDANNERNKCEIQ
jgi:ankyrin repeat protein